MPTKIQLDLFTEESELSLLRKELQDVCLQLDKQKRSLNARHQQLSHLCLTLKEENDLLKSRIDKLERDLQKQAAQPSNDDLLEKLFKEAYLTSS
ncbi:hypothetical protein PNK_0628 [Candidatus Protochlamydia naegleriophila]|uniref:Uncharacterized protein n=1 Tax=Candidatus Protochlamydia naegleriophila TaxID=389348 RepID=A0A0U5JCZ3_9BACT|nr:hypothetical protein [Candidatus Protochlamydia naegleriophila]CUI16255.1 hypothetical protein PNK_0628 [Candidatus Protochlamydia naegleriophila]